MRWSCEHQQFIIFFFPFPFPFPFLSFSFSFSFSFPFLFLSFPFFSHYFLYLVQQRRYYVRKLLETDDQALWEQAILHTTPPAPAPPQMSQKMDNLLEKVALLTIKVSKLESALRARVPGLEIESGHSVLRGSSDGDRKTGEQSLSFANVPSTTASESTLGFLRSSVFHRSSD